MGEARYLPLFITADVSRELTNSILASAILEKEQDEDFENRWSIITHPSQLHVSKPSNAPVSPFQSGFIDASVETLQEFVTSRCGEFGLGSESGIYMDWLADDAFGVIDARTAVDGTILFCVREVVDGMQEAEVRVVWDRGARRDQLLLKYMENATDITDQEILFLAQHISNTTNNPTEPHKDNLTLDQAKQKINDWIDDEQQGGRPKWFEIRMVVENAMKYSCGIWNIGPAAVLTEMREQFDEDGVMRY